MRQNDLIEILRKHRIFYPILPFDPDKDRLLRFDFTENNKQLTAAVLNDINRFSHYIDEQLAQYYALYGIGGYAEHRTIYSRSHLFDAANSGEEPRRLHLGIDIWGKAHTPVSAPMDGTIYGFAFNDHAGDYGATIILNHRLHDVSFFTLYGHLNLASIENLHEGSEIKGGELFAQLGTPSENGHWPPHLHFQVIRDMENWKSDYPGVCKFSEREYYLQNCPDPDLILRMDRHIRKRS